MPEIGQRPRVDMRRTLERLFDLDYEEPSSGGGAAGNVQKEIPKPKLTNKNTNKDIFLSFTLGIGITALINFGAPVVPQLIAAIQQSSQPAPVASSSASATNQSASTDFTRIPTLSAQRSTITGVVDPQTMTASYYWTFALENHALVDHEAKMEFTLPKGAVVSRATLWVNGVEQEAAFNAPGRVQQAYRWITEQHRDPLLVTRQADGTILVKMAPVPKDGGEVKLRIGITAPLKLNGENQATFKMPKMTKSNFGSDFTQDVHLESPASMLVNNALFKTRSNAAGFVLAGNIAPTAIGDLEFQIDRPTNLMRYATRATHALKNSYIIATVQSSPGLVGSELHLEKRVGKPDCPIIRSEDAAFRVSTLWAAQEIERIQSSNRTSAEALGIAYRVVSPVTGAIVMEMDSDYSYNQLHRDRYQTLSYASSQQNASIPPPAAAISFSGSGGDSFDSTGSGGLPMLQGATNGTLGPQSSDATIIQGVNTAGTVRVIEPSPAASVLSAVAPLGGSSVNWLIASTRDANCFECGPSSYIATPAEFAAALPFILLNLLGPVWLFLSAGVRKRLNKRGAQKALYLGILWLGLAVFFPDLSLLLLIGLAAARCLQGKKRKQVQTNPA